LRDKSKDFSMENLIKKFEYDMERQEKKLAKMKEMEKKGASNYDIDDIKLSDDEKEGDYFERMAEERMRKAKDFQDDPYKAKEDEKLNFEK
jgi:hypothetical protein